MPKQPDSSPLESSLIIESLLHRSFITHVSTEGTLWGWICTLCSLLFLRTKNMKRNNDWPELTHLLSHRRHNLSQVQTQVAYSLLTSFRLLWRSSVTLPSELATRAYLNCADTVLCTGIDVTVLSTIQWNSRLGYQRLPNPFMAQNMVGGGSLRWIKHEWMSSLWLWTSGTLPGTKEACEKLSLKFEKKKKSGSNYVFSELIKEASG